MQSLRLRALLQLQQEAQRRKAPAFHQQAIQRMLERLRAELAGNPKPVMDYRNFDPAQRFPMAIEAMRNADFLKTPKYQDQQVRANTIGADPLICEFADKLVRAGAKLGIPLFPHCIVRTFDEQASAYARGVSRTNPAKQHWPHMGFAVDVIHGTLGWMDKPSIPHAWEVVGHLGEIVANSMDIEIEWGGNWKFYDPAHFELKDWRERAAKRPRKAGEGRI